MLGNASKQIFFIHTRLHTKLCKTLNFLFEENKKQKLPMDNATSSALSHQLQQALRWQISMYI